MPKIHLWSWSYSGIACGQRGSATIDRRKVTCKNCLRVSRAHGKIKGRKRKRSGRRRRR